MRDWLIAALLQALALGVGIAEAVVPSFGILLVVCLGLFGYSWYHIVETLPQNGILLFGLLDLILVPVGIKIGFSLLGRSPIAHKSDLGTGSGLEEANSRLERLVGREGTVETQLRPTGKILIEGEILEASASELLERGEKVKVVQVAGGKITVERAAPLP